MAKFTHLSIGEDKNFDSFIDEAVFMKFKGDGYFDLTELMTVGGMLALCTTIIMDWMKERVKPETPKVELYKMADDMSDVIQEVLHDWVKDNFAK